jgi:3'(2'), 5'-bisphosphate nucleotidase
VLNTASAPPGRQRGDDKDQGGDEFTVNVALICRAKPVVGIIAAPAIGLVWRGIVDRGAERLRLAAGAASHQVSENCAIHVRPRPAQGLVAVVSRSHFDPETDAFLSQLPIAAGHLAGRP